MLEIRTVLLRPHPDHPHVVPDLVGVQGRVPVHHLTSPIRSQDLWRTIFESLKVIEKLLLD